MSNEEKERRERYIRIRKKRIKIQAIILIIVSIFSVLSFLVYNNINETYYINYTENGKVDYKVYLKNNDFYEDEYLGMDQAYVASLIENVEIDFSYKLNMESEDIDFEYSYYINAELEISDENLNKILFSPDYPIKEEQRFSQKSDKDLLINEKVTINYDQYNDLATEFVNSYSLVDTSSNLIITTHINVESKCVNLDTHAKNEYEVSLIIPLTTKTVDIKMTKSIPTSESKILACNIGIDNNIFKITTIGLITLDLILLCVFLSFIYLTKNHDINYQNKVNRIVNSYKSYIQKLTNHFDTNGYQLLEIDTFNELLEIRDTLQSPILMDENDDKTLTQFIIPTNSSILYVYIIKIDDYDEIYGTFDEVVDDENTTCETEPIYEESAEVPVEENVEENLIIDDDEEESGVPGMNYNYSFEAKLILADYQVKTYYENIVRFIKSYNVKIIRSWKKERVYLGKKQFAILSFRGKRLNIALALDPKEYEGSKYRFTDVSETKKYSNTPLMMKLTSDRKLKHTIELLGIIFKKEGLELNPKNVSFKKVSYQSRNALIKKGLIKVKEKQII